MAAAAPGGQQALTSLPEAERAQVLQAIRLDYAGATRVVFIGMAVALAASFFIALFHPGGRVVRENAHGSGAGPAELHCRQLTVAGRGGQLATGRPRC